MQYNESEYDLDSYNLTNYTSALTESIMSVDATVIKDISTTKTDSQGTADALSDGISLAALLDTVTIYQRAHTPFAYNNGRYNDFMYNVRADEDEILLMATKMCDGQEIVLNDSLQDILVGKTLLEMITDSDTLVFLSGIQLLDFVFFDEFFRIEITNKALNETMQVNDWLTIKQNPQSVEWFD